jgi:hypothetical protein
LWTVLAVLLALVGGLAATVRLLTWFAFYDDEGYMLISLAHYIKEGHLYTQTFSHYGPFYFYAQGIFFQLLHFPVTHDIGRLVTLVYWVASSLSATFFVRRISKSIFLATPGRARPQASYTPASNSAKTLQPIKPRHGAKHPRRSSPASINISQYCAGAFGLDRSRK